MRPEQSYKNNLQKLYEFLLSEGDHLISLIEEAENNGDNPTQLLRQFQEITNLRIQTYKQINLGNSNGQ